MGEASLTFQDEVLRLVRATPGIQDAELARKTGKRHQAVNSACRELEAAGRIERRGRRGSIQNFPKSFAQTPQMPQAPPTPVPTTPLRTPPSHAVAIVAELAEAEVQGIREIAKGVQQLRAFLVTNPEPGPDDAIGWFEYVGRIRSIQGNISNDASLLAGILARHYLVTHANAEPYDAAAKAQGASGLDIDERTRDGHRIVGEIKTTVPHQATDLGAQQRKTFMKDFEKLAAADAAAKYFFVTDRRTFDIVRRKYTRHIPGVTVVLLPECDTFLAA